MKDKEKANCHICVHEDICQLRTFSYCEEEVKEKGCEHYQPKLPEDARVFIPTNEQYIMLSREDYEKLCHLAYFGYEDAYEKGSKETAEKMYDKIMSFIGSNQKFWIVDDEHITIIDVDKLFDFVMETAKQFGVEVEE
jgi:hypothetical protein